MNILFRFIEKDETISTFELEDVVGNLPVKSSRLFYEGNCYLVNANQNSRIIDDRVYRIVTCTYFFNEEERARAIKEERDNPKFVEEKVEEPDGNPNLFG